MGDSKWVNNLQIDTVVCYLMSNIKYKKQWNEHDLFWWPILKETYHIICGDVCLLLEFMHSKFSVNDTDIFMSLAVIRHNRYSPVKLIYRSLCFHNIIAILGHHCYPKATSNKISKIIIYSH